LDKFYRQHTGQFFSSDALTSPEEVNIGPFMYLIFLPRSSRDDISLQKGSSFHDFPEMKTLREQLFENPCPYVEKP
jgi:hypothetical protein